jgi:hypothetical protein
MMSLSPFKIRTNPSIALKRKKIANVGFAKKLDTIVMNVQIQKTIRPKSES